MSLFYALLELEENDELHLSRLLILLKAFSGRNGTKTVEGLTKLAKLDFFLRYPVYLERALQERVENAPPDVEVTDYERRSIESSMVRYRYGPWDFRYRRFINLLVAKELAYVTSDGKMIQIGLTAAGLDIASQISKMEAFQDLNNRASILKKHFDLKATTLMNFVYDTFPEIATLRLGERIQ